MLSHLIKSAMFLWDHAALSLQLSAFMCTIYCYSPCTGEHFDLITFVCYTNHVLNLACLNVAFDFKCLPILLCIFQPVCVLC